MHAIIGDTPLDPTKTEISDLALVALQSITSNANVVLDLQTAFYMIDLSKTLIKYVTVENAYEDFVCEYHRNGSVAFEFHFSLKITQFPFSAKICEQFLSKDWYASDGSEARGVECNMLLDKLLQGYFHEAKFSFVRKQLTWIVEEIQDATGKSGFLKTFPCFKKCVPVPLSLSQTSIDILTRFPSRFRVNFPLFYRAIFASVIDALNRKLDKTHQNLGQLKVWESSCAIINDLLELAKLIDLSRVFTIFLKVNFGFTANL